MAKIHTVEWTPAILPHPVTRIAMNTNWYGLKGEDAQDRGRVHPHVAQQPTVLKLKFTETE